MYSRGSEERHGKIQGCVKRGEHIPGAFVGRQVHGEKCRILVVFEERRHIPVVLEVEVAHSNGASKKVNSRGAWREATHS
jgi:hypothetical protein